MSAQGWREEIMAVVMRKAAHEKDAVVFVYTAHRLSHRVPSLRVIKACTHRLRLQLAVLRLDGLIVKGCQIPNPLEPFLRFLDAVPRILAVNELLPLRLTFRTPARRLV